MTRIQILFLSFALAPHLSQASSACWNNQQLAYSGVDGGDTGAIVREVDHWGKNSIRTCVVIPHDIINFGHQRFSVAENTEFAPHLYLGFVFHNKANVEAGLAFQKGHQNLLPGMVPYLRVPSSWRLRKGCQSSDGLGNDSIYLGYQYNYRLAPGDRFCWQVSYSEKGRLSMDILPESRKADGSKIETSSHWIDCGAGFKLDQVRPKRNVTLASRKHNSSGDGIRHSFKDARDLGDAFFRIEWEQTRVGVYGGQWRHFGRDEAGSAACYATVNWPYPAGRIEDIIHADKTSVQFIGPKASDEFIEQEEAYALSIVPQSTKSVVQAPAESAPTEEAAVEQGPGVEETETQWFEASSKLAVKSQKIKPVQQSKQQYTITRALQLRSTSTGALTQLPEGRVVELVGEVQGWAYKLTVVGRPGLFYLTSKRYFKLSSQRR